MTKTIMKKKIRIKYEQLTQPKERFNFNIIDTVVIKYLVVCKYTCNNKIFKFGADKVC